MDIYVYTDESGVLDKKHEKYFIFGGLLFLDKQTKDIENRKYINAERTIRSGCDLYCRKEIKASILSNKDKGKLFRSLNSCYKFGVVVDQQELRDSIFNHKKTKQRYLDYAYKICLKRMLENLINIGCIDSSEVKNIYVFADEHTTATDGIYELKEGLEQEFKYGTHNYNYNTFYPPIFKGLNGVQVQYKDSSQTPLVRAADIVANRIYYHANSNKLYKIDKKIFLTYLP